MTVLKDDRRFRLYPNPDPRRSGQIGYLCAICSHEEIVSRYGLPETGWSLSGHALPGPDRVRWVCSRTCLIALAGSL